MRLIHALAFLAVVTLASACGKSPEAELRADLARFDPASRLLNVEWGRPIPASLDDAWLPEIFQGGDIGLEVVEKVGVIGIYVRSRVFKDSSQSGDFGKRIYADARETLIARLGNPSSTEERQLYRHMNFYSCLALPNLSETASCEWETAWYGRAEASRRNAIIVLSLDENRRLVIREFSALRPSKLLRSESTFPIYFR